MVLNINTQFFQCFEIAPVTAGNMGHIAAPVRVFCTLGRIIQPHSDNKGVCIGLSVVLLIAVVRQGMLAFPFTGERKENSKGYIIMIIIILLTVFRASDFASFIILPPTWYPCLSYSRGSFLVWSCSSLTALPLDGTALIGGE